MIHSPPGDEKPESVVRLDTGLVAQLLDAGDDRLAALTVEVAPAHSWRQALLAHVPDDAAAATGEPVRFVAVPPRLEHLIGSSPAWVVGATVTDVLPELDPQLVRTVARTGRPETTAAAALVRPDGAADRGTYVLVLPVVPLPTESEFSGQDRGEPLFELAFTGAPVGMAVTCGGEVLVRANQALAALLGREPADLVGLSLQHIGATTDAFPDEPGFIPPAAPRGNGGSTADGSGDGALPVGRAERRAAAGRAVARPFVHRAGRIVWLRVSAADVDCGPVRVTVSHFVDVSAERRVARQMAHAATHDELTGLPNRAWLTKAMQSALNDVPPSTMAIGRAPAVLFVDLDDFKIVNDSLGHDAGDRLLRQIAQRLRRTVRPEDTVARFGGDELVVLCQDLPAGEAADQLCQRLLAKIAEPVEMDGRPITVGASIGVAHADPTSTPQSLLRDADSAMYAAKRAGRNRYVVSDDLLRGFAMAALTEESELRAALDTRQLEVHVAPVRRLSSLRITAVDTALVWRHPVRGLLEPDYCVGLAARTGMSRQLGEFRLDGACRALPGWREQSGERQLRVGVDLTAEHLEHPDVVADVRHALRRNGTDPRSLIIGVPERALVNDSNAVAAHLLELSEEGVHLSLTGFGAGYSALGLLRRLPVGAVALDRMFLAGAANGGREAVLLHGLATLGSALGLAVQAAGADTAEAVRAAQAAGCTHASGRLLGELSPQATWPQPPAEELAPDANVVQLGRRSRRS
jgi:diguanylate cyclase (GGDEF)-like protein